MTKKTIAIKIKKLTAMIIQLDLLLAATIALLFLQLLHLIPSVTPTEAGLPFVRLLQMILPVELYV